MATSDNTVQIVIEAKDVASDVLKKTGVAFNALNKETTDYSKSLVSVGQALQVAINYADLTRVKVTDATTAIVGIGFATTSALGGVVSQLGGLTTVIDKIKKGVESPISQNFIAKIQQSAENATAKLAPLTEVLKKVNEVGSTLGTGFTQKLFNLDSRTIAQQLDDGVTLGIGRIGNKIRDPLKNALGEFSNESLQVFGKVAQRLDQELSKGVVDSTFALAIGRGPAQDIIKNIATNPAIAQYSPTFIKSLFSGSTSGAIDSLLLGVSQQIKKTRFSPVADLLGKSGIQNQVEILANIKLDTGSTFEKIDKQLADLYLDQRISQALGKNVSTGFAKSLLQNPAIKGILSGSVQDLVNGSFTDALLKVSQKGLSSSLTGLFNLANSSVENAAYKSGAKLANRLFDGLDPVIKQRNQRSRDILGSTFDGVGEKFTKGLGIGTNIPILSDPTKGVTAQLLSFQARALVTSVLPAPSIIVDQLINYNAIVQSLFKAIGVKGQIPGLKQLDVVLGQAVATGLGKAIDNRIPVILAPLVDSAANYVTQRFREAGSNAIASTASSFLPGYLKSVVKASLLETGASGFIFDTLIENLKPAKLISNFAALDGILANLKTNVNSALILVDTLLKSFKDSVNGIPGILENIRSILPSIFNFVSTSIVNIEKGIQYLLVSAFSGIELIKSAIPGLLGQAFNLIDTLKSSFSGGFVGIDNFLNTLKTSTNFGASFATQIEFIQARFTNLKSAADTSLSFIQTKILSSSNSFIDFGNKIQSAIASFSSFSSGFSTSLQSRISSTLQSVVGGIDKITPRIVTTFTGLIDSAISSVGGDGSGGFGKIFNQAIDSARTVVTAVTPIFNRIVTSLESNFGNVIAFIRNILGNITGIVAENLGQIIGNFLAIDFSSFPPGLETVIDNLFGNIFSKSFGRIGGNASRSFVSGFFAAGFERISPAINAIDAAVLKVYTTLSSLPSKIAEPLGTIAKIPGFFSGADQPLKIFNQLQTTVGEFTSKIVNATQSLAFFGQGFSTLQYAGAAPFHFLIGQTVELREQLLSTQASLVATSKISNNLTGQQVTDPTTAIQSLELPIKNAIADLRTGSLGLAGVTSGELVPLFQQIAGQITAIGGSLTNAKDLSLDFAAALGTLRIPLYQSRQEIGSILTGTIDQNSALAKTLNISNDQVANWKSQGRLVDELQKRLQPFRAGNALAAASLSGLTSNIKEIFDEIGRKAGEKLLDPLLKQVTEVYDYLQVNQTQFVSYFTAISDQILRVGLAVAESGKTIFSSIGGIAAQIPLYLFTSLANVVESVARAIQFASEVLSPAIHFVTELAQVVRPLAGELLQAFVTLQILSSSISALGTVFGTVIELVPGAADVLFLLDHRAEGVANQFINLARVFGTGGGGFLLLGKYLNSIPGASEAATLALGPLGGTLVGFIPTLAEIGIQVGGLIILFPALGAFLSNLLTLAPGLITLAGTFVSTNKFLFPLAPLFTQAAQAVGLYADATDRVALISEQFAGVIKNVGRAIAGQILTFGLLAGSAYLAFLAFDHFILQNETFKEILYGVIQGLGSLATSIKLAFENPFVLATASVTIFTFAVKSKLLPVLGELIGTTLAGWAIGVAGALGGLATTLSALGLAGLATSASTASVAVEALSIFMTKGAVASAEFLTVNGVATVELFGFSAAADTAAGAALTFATATGTLIGTLLLLAAPLIILAAGIGAIAFIRYAKDLEDSTTATEILAQQTAQLSEQVLKTASDLKKASDIQIEADKRGVRLSDDQYKANQRLINQANARKVDLTDQLAELNQQSKEAIGDSNKASIQTQINDVTGKIKLIDSLIGNLKIKPVDLQRLGSAYEQLAKTASAAEDAIRNSSGDPAIFKQKAEELISSTEKQSVAGQISAEEAIRRYNLVATNAAVSSDIQQKAQEAITAAFKSESEKRINTIQAEQAAISAQLALGKVDYENNAKAIADAQNSILKSRLETEQQAHETKLKQIQKEFDNQTFVNSELLKQKEAAANTSANKDVNQEIAYQQYTQVELSKTKALITQKQQERTSAAFEEEIELTKTKIQLESDLEASKARLAEKQEKAKNTPVETDVEGRKVLAEKIAQIEKDKNLALNSETIRNARIASELSSQIAENEAAAAKFAADLRIKVKTGAISQELAAERQLTFAKKTELETQLRNSNDTYDETRKGIEANFATTTKFLEDAIAKKQAEANNLPEGSKEYEAAQADITINNAKLISSSRAKNSALTQLELNHKTEVLKINADISKNQSDSAEKEASIAIKILERNQKKTLDAVQKAQNERIIQIQQLENKGLLDHTEVEEKKTEASKINIAAQLNEERLRLKALQALPRPKNQEKGADYDTQIRASQLKIQDLVKSSLDAELTLYHQHIEVVKGNIKDEDNIREAQLETQSRRGLVTQAQVTEELARRKVASLQVEYNLETKNASKRLELALAIEKAKTALLDAEIKTRQEKLELENQKLKNQIDEQNQSLKRQGDLYDILTKALEQRNKLLESSRDLAKAGTDFITGELEVLNSVEQSEYRRKQLAEITESIKLRSLQKQQEFERLSLFNQIEQNRLASERELIQNRIAQGEKLSSIAGAKADIAIAQADPRNKSEAGQAKINALQLKLQAEIDGLGLLQVQGGLIVQQAKSQETVAKAQIQQLDLKQQLEELKQEAALANALPPGKRQQAGRAIQDKIFKTFGQDGSSNFYNAAIAQSRDLAREKFGTSTNPDILAAINPELGGILDQVGGRGASAAIADTRRTFNKEYGNTQNITGQFTTGVAKTPLQLPGNVQRSQSLSDEILKQASQPISLPGGASLKLPSPSERGAFLSLENSGKLFSEGIDKLLTYLKDQNATSKKGGSTYNIKVDGGQKIATTTGNGNDANLENVLNLAKQMARAY